MLVVLDCEHIPRTLHVVRSCQAARFVPPLSVRSLNAMPVVIESNYSITIDGSPGWCVRSELAKDVDGKRFVKFRSWDPSLCKLMAFIANVDLEKKARPSLANCPGYKALLQLRNDCVTEFHVASDAGNAADKGLQQALFGGTETLKKKGKKPAPRLNALQLQELRENLQIIQAIVPSDDGPSMEVLMVKPAHPCEEVFIHLDAGPLEAVLRFIRDHGVCAESLTTKRQHGTDNAPGIWSNGSAGLIRKFQKEKSRSDDSSTDDVAPEAPKKQRFQTCNTKRQASLFEVVQPLADSNR